jgi:phosphoribosylanthranilate isomerase
MVAAGGLTPQNVASVVRDLRPWAVDVSSGVEHVRGQKSQELIQAFVSAVRQADASRIEE